MANRLRETVRNIEGTPVEQTEGQEKVNKKQGGSIVERNPYNYNPKAI